MSNIKRMLSSIIRENGKYVSSDNAAESLRELTELEAKNGELEKEIASLEYQLCEKISCQCESLKSALAQKCFVYNKLEAKLVQRDQIIRDLKELPIALDNIELSKKLQVAVETLEKYADKKNWHYNSTNTVCSTGHQAHCYSVFIFKDDCEKQDVTVKEMNVFSGCLARTVLEKIKEK